MLRHNRSHRFSALAFEQFAEPFQTSDRRAGYRSHAIMSSRKRPSPTQPGKLVEFERIRLKFRVPIALSGIVSSGLTFAG